MSPDTNPLRQVTRRHFFGDAGLGIGSLGLASILSGETLLGKEKAAIQQTRPLAPRATHFPARAKRVIYLFMAGGPSQLELFDFKPNLSKVNFKVFQYVCANTRPFLDKAKKNVFSPNVLVIKALSLLVCKGHYFASTVC